MPRAKADGTPDQRYSGSNGGRVGGDSGGGRVGRESGGGDARATRRRSHSPARPLPAAREVPSLHQPPANSAPLEPARPTSLQHPTSSLFRQAPRPSMPPLERTRLALCAAAVLGCLLLYALGDLLGVALYEAMGSSLVCATVPVAYTRMMVGGELTLTLTLALTLTLTLTLARTLTLTLTLILTLGARPERLRTDAPRAGALNYCPYP